MEFGFGIYGESGAYTVKTMSVDEVVEMFMMSIFVQNEKIGKLSEGLNVVFMVNLFGVILLMELYVVVRVAFSWFAGVKKINVMYVYVGMFMSVIDMNGFSVIVCVFDDDIRVQCFEVLCLCFAWSKTVKFIFAKFLSVLASVFDRNEIIVSGLLMIFEGVMVLKVIKCVVKDFIVVEDIFIKYDIAVGDGDCGITIRKGVEVLMKVVDIYLIDDVLVFMCVIGDIICQNMGGMSGVLYDIFFIVAADKFVKVVKGKASSVDIVFFVFLMGVQVMCQYGGVCVGDCMMLDVFVFVLIMVMMMYMLKKFVIEVAFEVVKAVANGVEDIKSMKVNVGCLSYVN